MRLRTLRACETSGNGLSGAERHGVGKAVGDIVSSPIIGETGILVSVGSVAWWIGIAGTIMALRQAGVSRAALVLLGLGGLMVWHVPIGPPALVCLSAAAYLIERRRESVPVESPRPVVAA
jgi:hypothetical protein